MKKVKFNSIVQVFNVDKYCECRFNEWIRRKIDFERRLVQLETLLGPIFSLRCRIDEHCVLMPVLENLQGIEEEEKIKSG